MRFYGEYMGAMPNFEKFEHLKYIQNSKEARHTELVRQDNNHSSNQITKKSKEARCTELVGQDNNQSSNQIAPFLT